MSEDYRSMWTDLGLDLEAHDALLGVLGPAYQDIYLAQKDRPEGMSYFDFVMSEVHGLRIKELLDEKKAGRKILAISAEPGVPAANFFFSANCYIALACSKSDIGNITRTLVGAVTNPIRRIRRNKSERTNQDTIWALKDVSFEVKQEGCGNYWT